ncbi:MAG: hypothetical protein QY326_05945 [Bdellovibrionota bacterium]|nr:MAG: hypothetical protein QY326_05945 [Bdellovibrionota bacterium]
MSGAVLASTPAQPMFPQVRLPFDVVTQDINFAEALARTRESLVRGPIDGRPLIMPDEPTAIGGLSAVYHSYFEGVGGPGGPTSAKVRVISAPLLDALTPRSIYPAEVLQGLRLLDSELQVLVHGQGHPFVPKLYAAIVDTPKNGSAPVPLGIVTEWVNGRALTEAVQNGLLTIDEAMQAARTVVESLARSDIRTTDPCADNIHIEQDAAGKIIGYRVTDLNVSALGPYSQEEIDHALVGMRDHIQQFCERCKAMKT